MSDRVLVAGFGKSGISAAKLLLSMGGEVLIYDGNLELKQEDILKNFDEEYFPCIDIKLGELSKEDIMGVGLCIISPGIDLETDFVALLDENGIQIWSEIQLGYHLAKGKLIAITGTNGKTTTTSLVGHIMKKYFDETFVVGNIGIPYTDTVLLTTEKSVTVLEASSFQLETIIDFRPNISAILNITPDHLNRHHTMDNYIRIKQDITLNQTEDDYCVLNYDDPVLRKFGKSSDLKAKVIFFSSTEQLEKGVYLEENIIYNKDEEGKTSILDVKELNILGKHNYENVMAAVAMSICIGVPIEIIKDACLEFKAVEHRIEFVAEKYGVKYYNDSKGTNPEAAIQAIKAMPGPTLIIAGGYDKGSSYDEWVSYFKGKVRYIVLIGQTRDAIAEAAKKNGFNNIMYAENMEEAVKVCASYADYGDYVLLSPACASWGMFDNFEQRGRVFKECVHNL